MRDEMGLVDEWNKLYPVNTLVKWDIQNVDGRTTEPAY
jgi:hypothetical protein